MTIDPKDFCVKQDATIDLNKLPTHVGDLYKSKEHYHELVAVQRDKLSDLQNKLYASNTYSLLLIFQGMDTSGKDGAIKNVMYGINPHGCQAFSFKQPSTEELEHDFLWRTTRNLPERGRIGIFNRSYYEEVLITQVHPEILDAAGLPPEVMTKKIWEERYCSIKDFEAHLYRNGTRVLKFFLHLSKDEQRKRLIERIDDPHKKWKFGATDIEERKFWKYYMKAYAACVSQTTTRTAPWYIVPADDKKNTTLIISQIVIDMLKDLKLSYPTLDAKRTKELHAIRKALIRKSDV